MRSGFSKNGKSAEKLRSELFAGIQVAQLPEYTSVADAPVSGTIPRNRCKTSIQIIPGGTIPVCVALHTANPAEKLGVLNFASYKNPGGGFMKSAMAQEEALCYCTNLYPALAAETGYYKAHNESGYNQGLYTDSSLLTKNITVMARDVDEYLLKSQRFTIDVLTCAAPNLFYLTRQNKHHSDLVKNTIRNRIVYILKEFALNTDADTIVLGAFGCGAFKNDPVVVAEAFKSVLENEFLGVFPNVIFAIPSGSFDSRYAKNYQAFYDCFKCYERGIV